MLRQCAGEQITNC